MQTAFETHEAASRVSFQLGDGKRHFRALRAFLRYQRLRLASVEWDEYQHAGDDEWCVLSCFSDNDGKLIEFEFEPCEKQRANDFFEKHFIERVDYTGDLKVNPKLLASVLKIFEINDLTPIIVRDGVKWELSAHNRDVTIKAVVMGVRK